MKNLLRRGIVFASLFTLSAAGATTVSDGNMVVTLTPTSGSIYSAAYSGFEVFRLGVFTANWGLQVGTDTTTFRTNTINDTSGIPVSIAGTTVTGTYTAGGSNVALTRTYQAVTGHETLKITNTFVNNGASAVTLRYFDTFDPDQVTSTTLNDVFVLAGKTVAQASGTGSPPITFILGFNGVTPVLSAGAPYDYNGITTGTLLNTVFTSPADGNGAASDSSVNLIAEQAIAPGGTWSFEVLLAFGGTQAIAQANFSAQSTAPVIAVEQPTGTGLAFSPAATVNFGTVGLLSTVSQKTFTLKNTGTASLTSSAGISFGGANGSEFTVTANPSLPLAPGGSTTFTVQFSPAAAGARSATMSIPSNDTTHTPFVVNLTGTGDGTIPTLITSAPADAYVAPGAGITVDPNVLVTGTGTVNGATVSVTGNFAAGDTLAFTNAGSIAGSYNSGTGILTLSGSDTAANYQAALRAVTFSSASVSTATRTITFSIGQQLFNPANGHSYEFVDAGGNITWLAAKAAAASRSLFGMQGYLATVTSASENAFIQTKLVAQGWMGPRMTPARAPAKATGFGPRARKPASSSGRAWVEAAASSTACTTTGTRVNPTILAAARISRSSTWTGIGTTCPTAPASRATSWSTAAWALIRCCS